MPSAPAAEDPPGHQGRTDARQSERHRLRHHHKLRDLPRDIPCPEVGRLRHYASLHRQRRIKRPQPRIGDQRSVRPATPLTCDSAQSPLTTGCGSRKIRVFSSPESLRSASTR